MPGRPASDSPIRIAYVVANEDLTSPLLTRQVVELLIEIADQSQGSIEIKLMLFQGLTSLARRWRRLGQLKKTLAMSGVTLSVIPNLTPWPFPNLGFAKTDNGLRPNFVWNRFAAKGFAAYAFLFLLYEYLVEHRRVFHTRSYPPAYAVSVFSKLLSDIKHLFDPRSDFPEENVVAGIWSSSSRNFAFWKKTEQALLKNADTTACISEAYVDHFKQSVADFPYFLAPNNVDTHQFSYDPHARARLRTELGWAESDFVFVYLGGMSAEGWHRPDFYREFLLRIREQIPNSKLLMLIPPHGSKIAKDCFSELNGVVVENPVYEKVPEWLCAADAGLMYMHKRRLAVGTKLGEYLSMGLPVICNSNCIGTNHFLKYHPEAGQKIDLALGDLDRSRDSVASVKSILLSVNRGRLRELADHVFSNQVVAEHYFRRYRQLNVTQDELI